MKEQERLQELYRYQILDTPPEKELDEIAQIASAICDTPISLISLTDAHRQWFKAKKGLDVPEAPREIGFCQHVLQNPKEVLVIDDPLNDDRFKDNPLVTGDLNVRFYAGAPLETPNGHLLGTLCIIDNKPRTISENQKKALQLLAKKAMDYLNARKLILEQEDKIENSAARLTKLSDQVIGAIYQFEIGPDRKISFPFISKGISEIHPNLTPGNLRKEPELFFSVIHPDDHKVFRQSVTDSYKGADIWNIEFRVVMPQGDIKWVLGSSKPEVKEDGTIIWYGVFRDITDRKKYINTLEQIMFDISHIMRRPVANLLGLTDIILEYDMDEEMLKEHTLHLKKASTEMVSFIRQLNTDYEKNRAQALEYYAADRTLEYSLEATSLAITE